MTSVAILVPVLDRPQRVRPLLDSLLATASTDKRRRISVAPVFLCSEGDQLEIRAVRAAGVEPMVVPWPATRGDFARKINLGARQTTSEWLLIGADDLAFKPGWLEAALACHDRTRACVIGTNDLGNKRVTAGQHSTHPLIHRDYLGCGTIDEPELLLHEGYAHNFCDTELVETAMHRETWAMALDSHVEHLHPNWRKGEDDATYRRGQAHFDADRRLFEARRGLWAGSWRASR